SYAASIGHAVLPRGVTKLYEEWISKFDSVSMREREGVDIVTSLLGREVDLVLDPTLLFRRSEWLSRLNVEARSGRGYVLVYLLMSSPSSIGLAKRIAKQMGLEVKVLVPNYWSPYLFVTGCEFIYTAGPREFVELMEGAEFVVTNSFHGAAFAINFNIPFIATPRRSSRVLSRFNSLLELLELRERLVFDSVEFENLPSLEVDFGVANSTLERERERSLSYLRDALQ
ncbi:MAG: polysaccharide pyruvyl transferase family protein, partial [Rikenellaceae bacterium]